MLCKKQTKVKVIIRGKWIVLFSQIFALNLLTKLVLFESYDLEYVYA